MLLNISTKQTMYPQLQLILLAMIVFFIVASVAFGIEQLQIRYIYIEWKSNKSKPSHYIPQLPSALNSFYFNM